MSKLPPFPDREVTVTLTGYEWTAILARITYSTPHDGLFSEMGGAHYKSATTRLQKQLLAASATKEIKLEVVR